MNAQPHVFNETILAAYLEKHISGFKGPLTAEKFSGGQSNPTFLISAASGQYVLRRKPLGQLLKSAHAVDREFKVINALQHTSVPVARAFHLCEDDSVIGSMFYVMSYEQGRIFWDPALPTLSITERGLMFDELIGVMAGMHSVDINGLGLADFGQRGNFFGRQVDRWIKQYHAAETETIPAMDQLIRWLPDNLPKDDGQVSLIHGDYRLDNLMFHPSKPQGLALLDWELSTLGHPLADLSYFCMCHRLPPQAPIPGLAGLDRAALGLPDEQAIIDRYCQLRGLSGVEGWNVLLAFNFFRLAGIAQGVYKRGLAGNASNGKALEVGRQAKLLAQMASELL